MKIKLQQVPFLTSLFDRWFNHGFRERLLQPLKVFQEKGALVLVWQRKEKRLTSGN